MKNWFITFGICLPIAAIADMVRFLIWGNDSPIFIQIIAFIGGVYLGWATHEIVEKIMTSNKNNN